MYETLYLTLIAVALFFEYRAITSNTEYFRWMFDFLALFMVVILASVALNDAIGTPMAVQANGIYWLVVIALILDILVFGVGILLPKIALMMADYAKPSRARVKR